MDRAERRRRERAAQKGHEQKQPVIVGEGIVAQGLGSQYEARPMAQLPEKQRGVHRWIAAASYVVTPQMARDAMDEAIPKFLDNENLFYLGIGCWDCEATLQEAGPDSKCPAGNNG